ncbi:MAG: hypothetical protein IKI66_08995, partial [Bacteroidales bacterium]|nr:hypothetical protein [Bacteroidales bacterium]
MSEDLNPVAPIEEQPVEVKAEAVETTVETKIESPAEPTAETESAKETETEKTDYSNKGLKEIVDAFKEMIDGENMQQLYKHAEAIKAAFYKNLRKEKIASGIEQPTEAAGEPAAETEASAEEPVSFNPFAEIERGFKDLYSQYKVKRSAYTQELEKNKEENYQEKL